MGLAGRTTPLLQNWDCHEFFDDFLEGNPVNSGVSYLSGVGMPSTWFTGPTVVTNGTSAPTSGAGTFTSVAGAFGLAALGGPAVTGAEATAFGQTAGFTLAQGAGLYFRARVRPDEVTTSGALSFLYGLASAPQQSGIILATGGGVRTSGNLFAVGKLSGSQNWGMFANVQGSGVNVVGQMNCGGNQSGQFYDIEGMINPDRTASGNVQFTAKVNGVFLKQLGLSPVAYTQPAVIQLPVDTTAMAPIIALRQGAAEAATVTVDKVYAQQTNQYP